MKKTVLALAALVASTGMLPAATITNLDSEPHRLIITEGGTQSEMVIGAGETIEICPSGCFIVLPNGDREVLTGTETMQIEASRGHIF